MNPILPIGVWASTVNYPTGTGFAWAGQPTKAPPGYTFFTPSVAFAPTATDLNSIFNQRDSWIQNLNTWTGALDGLNWGPLVAVSTIGAGTGSTLQWSAVVGQWVAWEVITGTTFVYASPDGTTWAQLGAGGLSSTLTMPGGILSTASGLLIAFGYSVVQTQTFVPASNNWAAAAAGPAGFLAAVIGTTIRNFNGGIVWAQAYPTGGGAAKIAWSANNAATWATSASTLPANFGVCAVSLPLFAACGATLMCLFSQTPAATQYITSPDGQNWTAATLPVFLAGEAIVGADYDATNAVFYLVYSNTTTTRVFASSTGLTGSWGVVATIGHPASVPGTASGGFGAFAANGGELALLLKVAGIWRVMLSTNGGTTWGFARSPPLVGTGWLEATAGVFVYQDSTSYALTLQAGAPAPLVI